MLLSGQINLVPVWVRLLLPGILRVVALFIGSGCFLLWLLPWPVRGQGPYGIAGSTDIFKVIMLVVLPATACYLFRKKSLQSVLPAYSRRKTTWLTVVISFIIGIYDGFYGPGTGTFLLVLLTAVAHVSLNEAAGTTKVINLGNQCICLVCFSVSWCRMVSAGIGCGCVWCGR